MLIILLTKLIMYYVILNYVNIKKNVKKNYEQKNIDNIRIF